MWAVDKDVFRIKTERFKTKKLYVKAICSDNLAIQYLNGVKWPKLLTISFLNHNGCSSIGIVKWEYHTWNVELNQWITMCNSNSVILSILERLSLWIEIEM